MTQRERDRFSDAAVAASNGNLGDLYLELFYWETRDRISAAPGFGRLIPGGNLVRARVYDSLSCDGLGVDEI